MTQLKCKLGYVKLNYLLNESDIIFISLFKDLDPLPYKKIQVN